MAEKSKNFYKKNLLIMIRSKYILSKITTNLSHNKLLEIVRYNKKIKNKLNKDINDYKKEYFKIEIEIIPTEFIFRYYKFINLPKKKESHYHVYFNDSKEEVKTNKIKEGDRLTKIKIILDSEIKSLFELFKNCKCIKEINFIKCNRDNIKNISSMFEGCSSLTKINLSKFNMDKILDMSSMFYKCSELKELELPNFNETNVINMKYMFDECSSLKELNLSNFYTNNVTNMSYMFCWCSSLDRKSVV